MSESLSLFDVFQKYKKFLIISLIVFIILIPVFDGFIIQRDRNRNMVYGEIFWQEGLNVYMLNDRDLYYNYSVPEDHLLTGVLNVTYEYPVVTLLFFAGLSAIEPGIFGPTHYLANLVFVLLMHINLILFVYLGQSVRHKRWFQEIFGLYYFLGFLFSVVFTKVEPLSEFLLLTSLVLFKQKREWAGFGVLALAAQTKIYPALVFPVFFYIAPLQSIAFFAVSIVIFLPLVLSGLSYASLIAHLLNSPGYAQLVTNPFFVGFIFTNPISIIAPICLLWGVFCAISEVRWFGPIPIPSRRIRTRARRSIYIYILPCILLFIGWTQFWYYSWFIVPFFLLKSEDDMAVFRYVLLGLITAHFVGVFLNLEYFLSGPIAEILEHLRLG